MPASYPLKFPPSLQREGVLRAWALSSPFLDQWIKFLLCYTETGFVWLAFVTLGKERTHWGVTDLLGIGNKINRIGASLVAQWLRICLLMQETRVWTLVWEDPACRGATRPVSHNYWACASGACAPQQERPRQWKACAPRWRVAPTCHN